MELKRNINRTLGREKRKMQKLDVKEENIQKILIWRKGTENCKKYKNWKMKGKG